MEKPIPINGRLLIEWSINHALSSALLVDEVWVSSDSPEILIFSESVGAKTTTRPLEVSGDNRSSESAWIDAIIQI